MAALDASRTALPVRANARAPTLRAIRATKPVLAQARCAALPALVPRGAMSAYLGAGTLNTCTTALFVHTHALATARDAVAVSLVVLAHAWHGAHRQCAMSTSFY